MNPREKARNMLVRRWSEMSGYWGVSRTMAEIHALLFVSPAALCTDDIMDQLKISRGNTSMNVRALVDWGLIRRVHKLGDRKEYFEADTDVWRMFETILRERSRREVEPIVETIDHCCELFASDESAHDPEEQAEIQKRLDDLRGFLDTVGKLFELALQFGGDGARKMAEGLLAKSAKVKRAV